MRVRKPLERLVCSDRRGVWHVPHVSNRTGQGKFPQRSLLFLSCTPPAPLPLLYTPGSTLTRGQRANSTPKGRARRRVPTQNPLRPKC
ncbi:hypothetical protein VZT92_002023 [Zoarces viviparus]|uniref:Uncharacterized protein n=1 Tax=Zoarces viviparus TaxID=48416 RepID=A0AAW1G639_ZOAVI